LFAWDVLEALMGSHPPPRVLY